MTRVQMQGKLHCVVIMCWNRIGTLANRAVLVHRLSFGIFLLHVADLFYRTVQIIAGKAYEIIYLSSVDGPVPLSQYVAVFTN
jgi:hypothetical protein